MSTEDKNHFLYRKVFPDFKSILQQKPNNQDGFKDYLFVLDSSTLLAPYNAGKESLDKIQDIYKSLVNQEALFIPVHSMLEFAKNRATKISDIFTNIDLALSTIPTLKELNYPILFNTDIYKKLAEFKESFKTTAKEYKELLLGLQNDVLKWDWQDPITRIYADTFNDDSFINTVETEENLLKEYRVRLENGIPPGNKDKSKDENAIGDFIIWKSIVNLGISKSKNIAFVTNDEKSDWMVRGNGKAITTRFELVNEYYRLTNRNNFTCINFSKFLKIQGAEDKVVNEIGITSHQASNLANQDVSNTKLEVSSFQSILYLRFIASAINNFLNEYTDEEDEFIREKDFKEYINAYRDTWSSDFRGTKYWGSLFNTLMFFNEVLPKIEDLSFEVEYQFHRQKASTVVQQIQLKALCITFIEKYDFLESLIQNLSIY